MKYMLIFILMLSCTKQSNNYTKDECEDISMRSYKGVPKDAYKLKTYCTSYKLKYTKKYCQKALTELIMIRDESYLIKKYGKKVMGCFSEGDKQKFLKN